MRIGAGVSYLTPGVPMAEDKVCGGLLVSKGNENKPGSIGCMAVAPAYRKKGIASNLVRLGTRYIKENGAKEAYLEYTHSGLDRLYGCAGFQITMKYFMA